MYVEISLCVCVCASKQTVNECTRYEHTYVLTVKIFAAFIDIVYGVSSLFLSYNHEVIIYTL